MSQPTPYTPTTDFSEQEQNNASGRSTVNTAALDAEFANLETTTDQLCANLALLQRDDGRLKDTLVDVHTLSRNTLNLIGGYTNRGEWLTDTAYAVNNIVDEGGYLHTCVTAHTSSALFATDEANWLRFGFLPSDQIGLGVLEAELDAHIADTESAHQSSAIEHDGNTVEGVLNTLASEKAPLVSPVFTGTPECPTAAVASEDATLANTAFVKAAIASIASGGETLASLGVIFNSTVSKTAEYTVVAGDKGKIVACSGTFNVLLTAATTLGDGFAFGVWNTGSGTITIDPNASELIDGATTKTLAPGKLVIVYCDGTRFVTVGSIATGSGSGLDADTVDGYHATGLPYVPTDYNATVPVGTIVTQPVLLSTGTFTNLSTRAGSGLQVSNGSTNTTFPGTWRNITGATCTAASAAAGVWQRIA